jgi:hypothetical protein
MMRMNSMEIMQMKYKRTIENDFLIDNKFQILIKNSNKV